MIRRSISVGLVGGFLMSLAGLYPLVSLFAPAILPGWERPIPNELVHGLLLMVSAALGMPALFTIGLFAALRSHARGWLDGAKAGLLAGVVAGLFTFITLISPLNALVAYGAIAPHLATLETSLPSASALTDYVRVFQQGVEPIRIVGLGAILFWILQGVVVGWRRRATAAPERPTLYGLVAEEQHPRQWLAGNESAARTGLLVGGLSGLLALFVTFGRFYVGFAQDWPELAAVIRRNQSGIFITEPLSQTLADLMPLVLIGLLGFGALIIALIKNPPDRFRARIRAVRLAANIILVSALAIQLRIYFFHLGLAPFWLYRLLQSDAELPPDAIRPLEQSVVLLQTPAALLGLVLIFPWISLILTVAIGWLLGSVQALFYALLIPLIHRRPVDEAARVRRRIKRRQDEVLPLTYGLFSQTSQAYDVLAHLSAGAHEKMPAVSQLAAAFHTLGRSDKPEDHAQTIAAIQTILSEHPEWRWSADFGVVFRVLREVAEARTLAQILAIQPPPEQHTSSLPPLVAKSVQRIGRIITELRKVEKVEDLPTKLIFLENTLEAIHDAQRFVSKELVDPANTKAAPPQHAALTNALDHWQGIVLAAVKQLKGRADIVCLLKNKQTPFAARLPVMCEVTNQGLNVAQQVRIKILPGPDHSLGADSEAWIEILPPGESRQASIPIAPVEGARRVRVAWEVTYDDAVDAERKLSFADIIVFETPDKPFQRIFPIPYVTGTPLKTDDVFVGRADVFAFIRENLLGAHQNNVIILHGQRRTGKTSVLYRLSDVMQATHYGVLIDMQGKPARGEADFLFSIADDIAFALEDHGIEVDLPARADFEEAPEFFFRSRFVRGLYPHLDGKNLLLMFDEFEELQSRVEDGRLQPEIFQFLRNLMQHDDRVDFIFSGTHKLEELGAEYWSVLFNIAAYKPITFLSANEMRQLILEPVAGYNLEYDSLAIDRITGVTAGHPYFTQLILHEMVVYHNETQRNYMTVMDVDLVLERIVERGEAHFKYIWSESSEEERLLLRATAELLVGAEAVNVKDLRAFLADRNYESADNWQRALTSLENRDILSRQSVRSQLYRYKVNIIRLWIDRTRPSL